MLLPFIAIADNPSATTTNSLPIMTGNKLPNDTFVLPDHIYKRIIPAKKANTWNPDSFIELHDPQGAQKDGEYAYDVITNDCINGLPFVDNWYTFGYSDDYDAECGLPSSSPDVAYCYYAPVNAVIYIDMCYSGYDTKLYVFENTENNVIVCNDDYIACDNYEIGVSYIWRLEVEASNYYYIIVDGSNDDMGFYEIYIDYFTDDCVLECPVGGIDEGEPTGCDVPDITNGGCVKNPANPVFSPINCGETICGTMGTFGPDVVKEIDVDIYELVLDQNKIVNFFVGAEFPVSFGFLGTDPPGSGNCDDWTGLYHPAYYNDIPCWPDYGFQVSLEPGTHWFYVKPLSTSLIIPCDANYVASIECYECDIEQPINAIVEDEIEACIFPDVSNGGCNSDPPVFSSIDCGQTIFGSSGTFFHENSLHRDTDWYQYTISESRDVVFTVNAEFPIMAGMAETNPSGSGDCADLSGIIQPIMHCDACEEKSLTLSLEPGTYWFFVAPEIFNGVYCGANYTASLICLPCDGQPGECDGASPIDILDIIHLIDYKFKQCPPGAGLGTCPPPTPYTICSGDADCNCLVDILDIIHLIDWKFKECPIGAGIGTCPPPCSCEEWQATCGWPIY
jgi:hypothetical protein